MLLPTIGGTDLQLAWSVRRAVSMGLTRGRTLTSVLSGHVSPARIGDRRAWALRFVLYYFVCVCSMFIYVHFYVCFSVSQRVFE